MATTSVDDLLSQYVECTDPRRAEALLEELVVEHAQPGIQKVVRYKLAFQGRSEAQDIEDVSGDIMVELIGRLRSIKQSEPLETIGSFSGYTAVTAYHACNEYLRRKYPNRHRLKNRLRYLLNNEFSFEIWEAGDAGWLCGMRQWRAGNTPRAASDRLGRWRDVLADLPHGQSASRPADLLTRVFDRLRGPVEFDELVEMMAWLWGVNDRAPVSESTAREIESVESGPEVRLELAQWLRELWLQILKLPRPQRVALLLNLRSGPSTPAAALLPMTGVASIAEIAETLGFTPEDFAGIWNALPLEDLEIARRLGLTRQQVINLRKSARERLTRRIEGKYSFR